MSAITEARARTVVNPSPRLINEDLEPARERTWGVYSIAAIWMTVFHNIGTYTFALGFFLIGLPVWQVFLVFLVAVTILYLLINLTAFAGQRTGVPFPVLARISFGVFGANLPALIRAAVAIFWYGIQTYLASAAVNLLLVRIFPGLDSLNQHSFLGLSILGWISFLGLWCVQLVVVHRGMESVRKYQNFSGPVIYLVMFALAIWLMVKAHWKLDLSLSSRHLSGGEARFQFVSAVALFVSLWGTYLLNYCDFSRFSPSRRKVRLGNFLGLFPNFVLFACTVLVITAGSVEVFGNVITDPVEIVGRIPSTFAVVIGALCFAGATVGVNVVGNFVSPAFDLANVAPRKIDFKRGGLIAAVLSLFVFPWKLYDNPIAVNYFISGVGATLGPLFGIIISDYYLLRRQRVDMDALYQEGSGPYWYRGGWNMTAIGAFIPAAAVAIIFTIIPAFDSVKPFAWFIGAALGSVFYMVAVRTRPATLHTMSPATAASEEGA